MLLNNTLGLSLHSGHVVCRLYWCYWLYLGYILRIWLSSEVVFVLRATFLAVSCFTSGRTIDLRPDVNVEAKTAQIGLYGFGLLVGFCCFLLQYYGYGVLLLMK